MGSGLGEWDNKTCSNLGSSHPCGSIHQRMQRQVQGLRGAISCFWATSLSDSSSYLPPAAKLLAAAEAVWPRLALDGKSDLELKQPRESFLGSFLCPGTLLLCVREAWGRGVEITQGTNFSWCPPHTSYHSYSPVYNGCPALPVGV